MGGSWENIHKHINIWWKWDKNVEGAYTEVTNKRNYVNCVCVLSSFSDAYAEHAPNIDDYRG